MPIYYLFNQTVDYEEIRAVESERNYILYNNIKDGVILVKKEVLYMNFKGVNRVVIAVKDLDEAVPLYSRLFNTTFKEGDGVMDASYGIRTAVSWDVAIEIVSPIPESNAHLGQAVAKFLERTGGGIYSVVFSVDNVEEAYTRTTEMGIRVSGKFELDQEQIGRFLDDKFKIFKQYSLNAADTCGVQIIMGQIELK